MIRCLVYRLIAKIAIRERLSMMLFYGPNALIPSILALNKPTILRVTIKSDPAPPAADKDQPDYPNHPKERPTFGRAFGYLSAN